MDFVFPCLYEAARSVHLRMSRLLPVNACHLICADMKKAPHGMCGAFRCEVVTSYARIGDQNGTVKRMPWKYIEKAMMEPIVAGRRIFMLLNLIFEGEKGVKNGRDCQHMGKTRNIFPGKLF